MEKNEHDKIIAFDTLYTNNHIQMMKIVMPYFDEPMRGKLAVYIKYLEFQHTLERYRSHSYELSGCSFNKEDFNIQKLCSELLPFCTGEEKKKLEQIAGIFHSMEMYKEMSRTMEMMKDFAPDLFSGNAENNDSNQNNGMMEMLMGMLSPEQQSMFEMFGGNVPHEPERMDE